MKAVATRNEIAFQFLAVKLDCRPLSIQVVHADFSRIENDASACLHSRLYEVFDHFLLAIYRDATAAGQRVEIDAMPLPVEQQLDATMDQAFAFQPLTHARLNQ